MLGQGDGTVVARDHGDALNHLGDGHLLALLQVDLRAAHAGGVGRDGDHVIQGNAARVHRLHDQKQGHDLGDAGRLQLLMGVILQQDGARLLFHQQAGGAGQTQPGVRRGRSGRKDTEGQHGSGQRN